ncbi:class I SAM-dependent methyltransferase [Paenibacillus albiflavus]|uniref:class I SAM-dependent methyltransferase n=1 Tax=Paenibacillus albiflavus TaxID=2545760 RepID=UPI0014054E2D|nr:class I SAM-dependent methyltransferase [Paenibacillus albiflavus]
MNREFIVKHWYADIYEQFENHTNDVEFLLKILNEQTDQTPQNILEVACGGGRICIPLAQAGHKVTGFDADEHMLLRCYRRMKGLSNLQCFMADATTADWGTAFDVVILAGNILINIESDMDYAQSQAVFIRKAAEALRSGGHLYLDFDLHFDPSATFNGLREGSYFKGTDDLGTYGRTISYGSIYNPITQICAGVNHIEITTNSGDQFIIPEQWYKHIPTQAQVYGWLKDAGFTIERTFINYTDQPLAEPLNDMKWCRATIWARKV